MAMRVVLTLSLGAFMSAQAAELYREEFSGTGSSRPASEVGWKIWRRNATTGLAEDGTADTSGTRATLSKSSAYPDHLYNGHNANEQPILAWTEEFPINRASASPQQFSWSTYNLNTVPTTQLALKIGGVWYLQSQKFSNEFGDAGDWRTNSVTLTSGSWNLLNYALGQAPSIGGAVALPAGDIQAFGLYLVGEPDNQQVTGATQHRIDAFWIDGAAGPVTPKPTLAPNITTAVIRGRQVFTIQATTTASQLILQGTTNLSSWSNLLTNTPAADGSVMFQVGSPLPGLRSQFFRVLTP